MTVSIKYCIVCKGILVTCIKSFPNIVFVSLETHYTTGPAENLNKLARQADPLLSAVSFGRSVWTVWPQHLGLRERGGVGVGVGV